MSRPLVRFELALLLAAPLLGCESESSTSLADAVDDYVIAEMERRGIPGLALSVARDGKIIKTDGYGLAHVALRVSVTPETVFRVASITKTFTASAIMSLVEEEVLSLDIEIRDLLPEVPESWAGITIRHLLSHSSGLNDRTWYGAGNRLRAYEEDASRPPGETFEYSDFGYEVLGLVIEKVSGKPYRRYLADRFFNPLGMVSSSVGVHTGRAIPYGLIDAALVRTYPTAADGGLFTNVQDLAIWDIALSGGRVLESPSVEAMWTPFELADGTHRTYGLGWSVFEVRGHRVVGHGGSLGHYYLRFPEDGLTVIVLTNLAMADGSDPRTIAEGVASQYLTDLRVSSVASRPNWDAALERTIRGAIYDIARNDRTSSHLVPSFRSMLSQASWAGLIPKWIRAADLERLEMVACEEPRELQRIRYDHPVDRVCYARLITEVENRYFEFYLTASGHIAHVHASTE